MKSICIALLALLTVASCSTNKEEGENVLVLGQGKSADLIQFSDLFDSVEFIPLDTERECLVTNVSKIVYYAGHYYMMDNYQQKCIIVFDGEGHFVRRIGTVGNGHGEYPSISDFTIDQERKRVIVLTNPSTVYIYGLDGSFQETKNISESLLWNVMSVEDGFICSSNHFTYTEGEDAFLFYEFDKDFNVRKKWGEVFPQQLHVARVSSSVLQNNDGMLSYIDRYANDIYSLRDRAVRWHIEFPNPMPRKYFISTDEFLRNQYKYDYLMDALIYEDKILVSYVTSGDYCVAYVRDGDVVYDGPFRGVLPNLYSGERGEVVAAISSEAYLQRWKETDHDSLSRKIEPGDNYLLMRCKFK